MSQEELISKVEELNNKFAEDIIKDRELIELYRLIGILQADIKEELYERKIMMVEVYDDKKGK